MKPSGLKPASARTEGLNHAANLTASRHENLAQPVSPQIQNMALLTGQAAQAALNLRSHDLAVRTPLGDLSFHATPRQLFVLFGAGAVMLHGHPRRPELKFAILQVGERKAKKIAGISLPLGQSGSVIAEDNQTSVRYGRGYRHVAHRCSAYAPNMPPLDKGAL